MELSSEALRAAESIRSNTPEQGAASRLSSFYWSTLADSLGTVLRAGESHESFFDGERDFVDTGLVEQLRDDAQQVRASWGAGTTGALPLNVWSLSEFLGELITEVTQGNRKELLEKEIARGEQECRKCAAELASTSREQKVKMLAVGAGARPGGRAVIEGMAARGRLALTVQRTKRAVAKGSFLSVQQRRELVALENRLEAENKKQERLLSGLGGDTDRAELREMSRRFEQTVGSVIEAEERVERLRAELTKAEAAQEAMSTMEIESAVREEIDYIRGLMKLCAKRAHADNCPLLRPSDMFFTAEKAEECLRRVLEFDPRVLDNSRSAYLGNPAVLLVPGNGNGMYDWKRNRIVLPLVPPGGDFAASLAAGIIEYRLDVDEDKALLESYHKLPQFKGVRSVLQLRANLAADYTTWITAESRGYRVLPKETRAWFEHEIAPSKQDVYCPPGYREHDLSSEEFRTLLGEIETRLTGPLTDADPDDLWLGGILNCQGGNLERAFECLNAYAQVRPENHLGHFNLGQVALKTSRKQDAVEAFGRCYKCNPQSWWAAVAREHLRRLQQN